MRRVWLIFSQAVTVAVAALFVVTTLKPEWLHGRAPLPLPAPTVSVLEAPALPAAPASAPQAGLAGAARIAMPAVVSINTSKAPARNPHLDDPAFRFFFGDRGQRDQPQVGLGSGVIVSTEGYLLTNNHVVAEADDIEVQLADGRRAPARVVGTDPETDLAVLKIDAAGALPVVAFGDAQQLQVGDAVLAIGNPFGVGQTATAGIVSALGRNRLGLSTFENFIQTDAAINPGNSGGALVDARGALVGINTAIFSRSGGSMGIGFAVPADLAREVLEAIVKEGRVVRGWVGVEPRDLTPEIVESLKLKVDRGVLITGVLQDGPASAAGLRPGDVVTRVGEREVASTAELLKVVAALKPQSHSTIAVQRGGQTLALDVTIGQRPAPRPVDNGR
jgi:Do/DeqQ family serine protease